eukprot:4827229-Prymnesium_polylepis.1
MGCGASAPAPDGDGGPTPAAAASAPPTASNELDLTERGLNVLPALDPSLEKLIAADNELTALPPSIGSLSNLKNLDASALLRSSCCARSPDSTHDGTEKMRFFSSSSHAHAHDSWACATQVQEPAQGVAQGARQRQDAHAHEPVQQQAAQDPERARRATKPRGGQHRGEQADDGRGRGVRQLGVRQGARIRVRPTLRRSSMPCAHLYVDRAFMGRQPPRRGPQILSLYDNNLVRLGSLAPLTGLTELRLY